MLLHANTASVRILVTVLAHACDCVFEQNYAARSVSPADLQLECKRPFKRKEKIKIKRFIITYYYWAQIS